MAIKTTDTIETLRALNIMASYIGIPPINNLSKVATQPDFTLAQEVLDEVTRSTLSQGLPCNVDYSYPLNEVNDSLEVIIPEGALICDLIENNYVERDGVVYNLETRTNVTQTGLKADITWNWMFDDLPELVKQYIIVVASRAFVGRVKGEDSVLQLTIPDERRVKQEFQRYVYSMGDVSILDGELPFAISRAGRNCNSIHMRY